MLLSTIHYFALSFTLDYSHPCFLSISEHNYELVVFGLQEGRNVGHGDLLPVGNDSGSHEMVSL